MNRRAPLIGGLIAVVLVAGWFIAVWRPEGSHLTSLRAARVTALSKQAQLDSRLAGLNAIKRSLPAEEAELQRSLPALPVTVSADTAVDQINAIALSDHIVWSNETQTATAAATASSATSSGVAGSDAALGASTLALTLDVSGGYANMQRFITDLQERPRLIMIATLDYAPGSGKVSVAVTAEAFYDATALPPMAGTAGAH